MDDDILMQRFYDEHASPLESHYNLLKFSDLHGKSPFEGQLNDLLSNTPLETTLEVIAWTGAGLRKQRSGTLDDSLAAMVGFFPEDQAKRLSAIARESRALLCTDEALTRLAIARLLADDRLQPARINPVHAVAESLLIVNEIMVNSAPDPVIAHMAGAVKRALRDAGNGRMLLYRYLCFRDWAKGPIGSADEDYVDLETEFLQAYEIGMDDFFAAGFFFGNQNGLLRDDGGPGEIWPIFPINWNALSNVTPLRSYLRENAVSRSELWDVYQDTNLEGAVRNWHRVLLRRPIVALDKRRYYVPSRSFLVYVTSVAPFFKVFEAIRKDEPKRLRLSRFFGSFFEQYTRNLLRIAARTSGLRVIAPQKYGKHGGQETTDTIVWDGEHLFFFESVATWVPDGLIGDLDSAALFKLLSQVAHKKMKQLSDRIDEFRRGDYVFDKIPAESKIIPVIVHPQSLPRGPLFSLMIRGYREKHSLRDELNNLEFLEVEALESAVEWIGGRRDRLWELFSRKAGVAKYRSVSFMEFIQDAGIFEIGDVPGSEDVLREFADGVKCRTESWVDPSALGQD